MRGPRGRRSAPGSVAMDSFPIVRRHTETKGGRRARKCRRYVRSRDDRRDAGRVDMRWYMGLEVTRLASFAHSLLQIGDLSQYVERRLKIAIATIALCLAHIQH